MTAALDLAAIESLPAAELIEWAFRHFREVALVASFQAESVVLMHMATRVTKRPRVITIDTGRLPEATHSYIAALRARLDISLEVLHPDPAELAPLVNAHGPNPFYESVELRRRCCEVRKVLPLRRALAGCDAWITGLRRDQSESRRGTPRVTSPGGDEAIHKLAPLAGWTRADVWGYLREHDLEPHPLYAEGYGSIGCAPCTRPLEAGEPERAGRWWWEQDAVKECGLHWTHEP